MAIVSKIDRAKNLTIVEARGAVTFDDIMGTLEAFYQGEVTRNVLWDFGDATVWDLSAQDVEKLAVYPPRINRQEGDKTAIVASDTMTQALYELFVLFQDSDKIKAEVRLFEDLSKARAWLLS